MKPHPDFAETTLPRHADLGRFLLSPLSGSEVDEDFEVIKQSEPVLRGLFTGTNWPADVTLASNTTDLHWHDREFTTNRSFSWIVRDIDGGYAGCAYLFPDSGARGSGEVCTWMRDTTDRLERLAAFNAVFREWLVPFLPPGYEVRWISNDAPVAPSV